MRRRAAARRPPRAEVAIVERLEARCLLNATPVAASLGGANHAMVLNHGGSTTIHASAAITPLRGNTYVGLAPWLALHNQFAADAATQSRNVVFLGDSITYYWGDTGRNSRGYNVWERRIAPFGAANYGIPGDNAENVLWRVQNGELAGQPKLVVLQVGTNDLGQGRSPDQTAAAITAVVNAIHTQSPQTKILLLGLFPRGASFLDPIRAQVKAVNATLAKLADGTTVTYMDFGSQFLQADGTFVPNVVDTSYLHLIQPGYVIWADAIQGPIQALLGGPSNSLPTGLANPLTSFDGSGTTNLAVYDQSAASFRLQNAKGSGPEQVIPFGSRYHTNIPVSGDFNGDGKTDLAIYDQTTAIFYIRSSGGGGSVVSFGTPGHVNLPLVGDYNGDGKSDLAIYDQTDHVFSVLLSGGGVLNVAIGNPKDLIIPVAGDFDGDGVTDIAIYDETTGYFGVLNSTGGFQIVQIGTPGHVLIPVPADYDGDGITDMAIYDQTTATFGILFSNGGSQITQLGLPGHNNLPMVGDFNGDGIADLAVFDQSVSAFLVLASGVEQITPFGKPGHVNLPV